MILKKEFLKFFSWWWIFGCFFDKMILDGDFMWLYVVVILVVILVLTFIIIYNSLVRLDNKVKEAFAAMDVYMKKRWDLIPNLVETVKGYVKHESELLEKVVVLRNKSYDRMSSEEKLKSNNELSSYTNKIRALAESYPDLKASENFIDLSGAIRKLEDEIGRARSYYNSCVTSFNDKVMMFPSNIVALLFRFKVKSLYEISDVERENVKVKF